MYNKTYEIKFMKQNHDSLMCFMLDIRGSLVKINICAKLKFVLMQSNLKDH